MRNTVDNPLDIPEECPKCNNPVKRIPGGVSKKTGKSYPEFWACSNMKCDQTWNVKKDERGQEIPPPAPAGKVTSSSGIENISITTIENSLSDIHSELSGILEAIDALNTSLRDINSTLGQQN